MADPERLTRYFVWAVAIAIGILAAFLDRRSIGWPSFGVMLVTGVVGGLIIYTPFTS